MEGSMCNGSNDEDAKTLSVAHTKNFVRAKSLLGLGNHGLGYYFSVLFFFLPASHQHVCSDNLFLKIVTTLMELFRINPLDQFITMRHKVVTFFILLLKCIVGPGSDHRCCDRTNCCWIWRPHGINAQIYWSIDNCPDDHARWSATLRNCIPIFK